MTFPATRLGLKVELALGADVTRPDLWEWTDVSGRILDQGLSIHRGRSNESGALEPSTVTVELDNRDGALTPGNGASPYYPNIRRGTPLRVSVEGGTPALLIPGGSTVTAPLAWASTPDHASLDITGDIDIRARIEPDAWSNGVTWNLTQLDKTPPQRVVGKWGVTDNTANLSWILDLLGAGWPSLEWTSGGTFGTYASSTVNNLWAASGPLWIGVTLDVNNGAGGFTARYYATEAVTPGTDITTWRLIGTHTSDVFGTTSIYSGAAPLYVGLRPGGVPGYRGRIHAVEVRNGINGTVVANPYFSAQTPGATSFNDGTGKTWTLGGVASISTQTTRFAGYIDAVDLAWPYGDHNARGGTTYPSESRVRITASDITRRLGQGAKALRSPLYRYLTSVRWSPVVIAYWPFEDPQGATQVSSGLTGGPPLTVIGLDLGADSTLRPSGSLAKIGANTTASWTGDIPLKPIAGGGYRGDGHWVVECMVRIPTFTAEPGRTELVNITAQGSCARWVLAVSDANVHLDVYDSLGTSLHSSTVAFDSAAQTDRWVQWRLQATSSGGVTWAWTYQILDTGATGTSSDAIAGQGLGLPARIETTTTAPANGMSFGHLLVTELVQTPDWMNGTNVAWVGESAAHRIFRLGMEDGVPIEIIGDPDVFLDTAGAIQGGLSWSEPVGPQTRDTFLGLLTAAAAVDDGILYSRRTGAGLAYRTRRHIEDRAATPALTLNATSNHVTWVDPKLDDQRLRNSVTVSATDGDEATVTDTASVATEALYQELVELNTVGGVPIQDSILVAVPGLASAQWGQNLQQAGWRVALGTSTDMRWPTITVDLSIAPTLIPTVHALELGDRVSLTGLPVQVPTDVVEGIVEAIDEHLSPTAWLVQLTCAPGGPWLVGRLAT
jgi:hypothetical protein